MKRLWRLLSSIRTALWLILVLSLLLLLNIVVPQRAVLGDDTFNAIVEGSAASRFLLVTLGFGSMPTNPFFLGVLGLFFINLACSLVDRARPMLRRARATPPSPEKASAWLNAATAVTGELPEDWAPASAADNLRAHGYKVRTLAPGRIWGIRNAAAPLGFLLFHASFFLLCWGGIILYGTRFSGIAQLVEGTEFGGDYSRVTRDAPWAGTPDIRFVVENVAWRFENGEPVHLGANIRFLRVGGSDVRPTRVNHPAEWGATSILIQRAGLAPVLWLQDENGYTIDRVAVTTGTLSNETSFVPLDGGRLEAAILPADVARMSTAEAALNTPVRFHIQSADGETLFKGELARGEAATVGQDRIVLQDVRLWAGLLIIRERGGGVLVAGFLLGVAGLVWRMVWTRREVVVEWNERTITIAGRSEQYPLRFREELAALRDSLVEGSNGREEGH